MHINIQNALSDHGLLEAENYKEGIIIINYMVTI